DDLEPGGRREHLVPEPRRLEHEVARAERERRPLLLVDELRLAGEAVDQLKSDLVMVNAILDRATAGRADVAGDPAAAEARRQEIAVEQTRAPFVEGRFGETGMDEGWGCRGGVEPSG